MKTKENIFNKIKNSIQIEINRGIYIRSLPVLPTLPPPPKQGESLIATVEEGSPEFYSIYTWNSSANSWQETGCLRKDPFSFIR